MQDFRILGTLEVIGESGVLSRLAGPGRAPSSGLAPARGPRGADRAARGRALWGGASEVRDGVAPELGRSAEKGARPGPPRHPRARISPQRRPAGADRCAPLRAPADGRARLLSGGAARPPAPWARALVCAPRLPSLPSRPGRRRRRRRLDDLRLVAVEERIAAGHQPRPGSRCRARARRALPRAPASRACLRAAHARPVSRGPAGGRIGCVRRDPQGARRARSRAGGERLKELQSKILRHDLALSPRRNGGDADADADVEIAKAILSGRLVPVLGLDGAADLAAGRRDRRQRRAPARARAGGGGSPSRSRRRRRRRRRPRSVSGRTPGRAGGSWTGAP